MKKLLIIIFWLAAAMLLASCSPAAEDEVPTDELIATQVSIILTETAIHAEPQLDPTGTATVAPPTIEPEPEEPTPTLTATPTETPTETPTSTPDQQDPAGRLGAPAWIYEFSGDSSPWDYVDTAQATFKTANGYLNLTAKANPNWHSWYVSMPTLRNAYVEATLQMTACSGLDRVGLALRGSSDGQQFYFVAVTCDGRWGLFRMAENVNINTIIGYQEADSLHAGLTDPHRIGLWMEGNQFTVYINGVEVGSATDDTLTQAGYTGFLIAFANTPGFTVKVDQLRYWNVP
jgi:hypothetical protein